MKKRTTSHDPPKQSAVKGVRRTDDSKRLIGRFKNTARRAYERFLKIRGEPKDIALGFALGLFVGLTPTMGVQIVIAVFLAALLRWNKIAAAAGVFITNPVTAPLIYSVTYLLGARILGLQKMFALGGDAGWQELVGMLLKTPRIFAALTLGGVIIGLPLAVLGYFLVYSVITQYRLRLKTELMKKRQERKNRRRKKQEKPRKGNV